MSTDMPNPADDLAGCLAALVNTYGDEFMFHLIGGIRTNGGPNDVARQTRVDLARRMVNAEGGDPESAMRIVAERLGYTDKTRTSFYKLFKGLARSTNQPID